MWVSEGTGEFEISELDECEFDRGTKIILHLKTENDVFTKKEDV